MGQRPFQGGYSARPVRHAYIRIDGLAFTGEQGQGFTICAEEPMSATFIAACVQAAFDRVDFQQQVAEEDEPVRVLTMTVSIELFTLTGEEKGE